MKRALPLLLLWLSGTLPLVSQTVHIPDVEFLYALIDRGVDTNGDSLISHEEAEATSKLEIEGFCGWGCYSLISDYTGLEAFINLDTLLLAYSYVELLDISPHTRLRYLQLREMGLIHLDLSNNPLLETLECPDNQLTVLDLSVTPELKHLDCNGNPLGSLDLSGNQLLETLSCSYNQLAALDVAHLPALKSLQCEGNMLTSLVLSNNPELTELFCGYNQLPELEPSNATALKKLSCSENELNTLDLSSNEALVSLECMQNNLTSLNLSNNPALEYLECSYNNLVTLDLSSAPSLNRLYCNVNNLTRLDLSNNPDLYTLECSNNNLVTLDLSSAPSVNRLHCNMNNLTGLDLSHNPELQYLDCSENNLSSLDLSKNTVLFELRCSSNQLSYLDVSDNQILNYFDFAYNQLVHIDLSGCLRLGSLNCSGNPLAGLDLQYHTDLYNLFIMDMPDLYQVCVWSVPFENVCSVWKGGTPNVYFESRSCGFVVIPDTALLHALIDNGVDTDGDSLITFSEASDVHRLVLGGDGYDEDGDTMRYSCTGTSPITDLTGLEAFSALDSLWCRCTMVEEFIAPQSPELRYLDLSDNRLKKLDVSDYASLSFLNCQDNLLTHLDLSQNANLKMLDCSGNLLPCLDISMIPGLDHLGIGGMPSLFEVCVWEVPFALPGGIFAEGSPDAWYSTECVNQVVVIPDTAFLHDLIKNGIDLNGDSLISILEAETATSLKIGGAFEADSGCGDASPINDLTGMEAFNNLDTLIIRCTQITRLDLSHCRFLEYLDCRGNRLSNITLLDSLRFQQPLKWLDCSGNMLAGLNIEYISTITYLDCSENWITSLEMGHPGSLRKLDCSYNWMEDLQISLFPGLSYLDCSGNFLGSVDIRENAVIDTLILRDMYDLSEICYTTMPAHIELADSPRAQFENECNTERDRYENNDSITTAVSLPASVNIADLKVSSGDDDWYELSATENVGYFRLQVVAVFGPSAEEVQMELVDRTGALLAVPEIEGSMNILDTVLEKNTTCYLHVSVPQGRGIPYSVWWRSISLQDCTIDVCGNGNECREYEINGLYQQRTHILDTLKVELWAGDRHVENISFLNKGPTDYGFYSVLDLPHVEDTLNRALFFDGLDGYAVIPCDHILELEDSLTMEAWIRMSEESSGRSPIISRMHMQSGYELYVDGPAEERRLGFCVNGLETTGIRKLENEQWYHVTVTFHQGIIRLYVDGKLDATVFSNEQILFINQDLYFGANNPFAEPRNFFHGTIDEIRIWNHERVAWELNAFMHRELTGNEEGLEGYWSMQENYSNVVTDYASGNSGRMIGGVTRTSSSAPIIRHILLSTDFLTGEVDTETDYAVHFDASGIVGGEYFADIQIFSPHLNWPDFVWPVRLVVQDAPSIEVHPDSLVFGDLTIYRTHTRKLEINNLGTRELIIDSIRFDTVGARITPGTAVVKPGERQSFDVDVLIRGMEAVNGNVIFYSNDPSDPIVQVPLSAKGSSIEMFALLTTLVDTLEPGSLTQHIKTFPNNSTSFDLRLLPSIITYRIPEASNDQIPQPEAEAAPWLSTPLPDEHVIPPGGSVIFSVRLDARGLGPGDYMGELVFEWYNPYYAKGMIPVRLHVRDTTSTGPPLLPYERLSIYPNPANGTVHIRSPLAGAHAYRIINMNGKVVGSGTFTGEFHRMDLSGLPGGIYFLILRSGDFSATGKIIMLQ